MSQTIICHYKRRRPILSQRDYKIRKVWYLSSFNAYICDFSCQIKYRVISLIVCEILQLQRSIYKPELNMISFWATNRATFKKKRWGEVTVLFQTSYRKGTCFYTKLFNGFLVKMYQHIYRFNIKISFLIQISERVSYLVFTKG